MEKEIEYFKKRIEFLELLVDAFNDTTTKALATNELLLDYIKEYYPKNPSTSS